MGKGCGNAEPSISSEEATECGRRVDMANSAVRLTLDATARGERKPRRAGGDRGKEDYRGGRDGVHEMR
jgi:hypothetical protein